MKSQKINKSIQPFHDHQHLPPSRPLPSLLPPQNHLLGHFFWVPRHQQTQDSICSAGIGELGTTLCKSKEPLGQGETITRELNVLQKTLGKLKIFQKAKEM